MTNRKALVVGGTGPTGPLIVNGLLARGYDVAIFHRGTHESDEIPPSVEHIHGDPHFRETIEQALSGRAFDLVIATYGRIRLLAEVLVGRVNRFIAVGGAAVYRGFKEPDRLFPAGLPVPTTESAQRVVDEDELRFARLLTETEEAVFRAHPSATMFRYPYVYGPHQLIPREWCVMRRILDGRREILLPDGGLTLAAAGYVENLAHAVMLSVDKPQVSGGRAYNCGDETTLTLRQMVEVIAGAMGAQVRIVNVPNEVAWSTRPYVLHLHTHHWLMDLGKIKADLGYRDVVPVREALARTVRWYLENPPARGGEIEQRLADAFDYAEEDRIIRGVDAAVSRLREGAPPDLLRPHAYAHPKAPGARDHRAR